MHDQPTIYNMINADNEIQFKDITIKARQLVHGRLTGFGMAPISMTLNDLKRPQRIILQQISFPGARCVKANEDRPILSAEKR